MSLKDNSGQTPYNIYIVTSLASCYSVTLLRSMPWFCLHQLQLAFQNVEHQNCWKEIIQSTSGTGILSINLLHSLFFFLLVQLFWNFESKKVKHVENAAFDSAFVILPCTKTNEQNQRNFSTNQPCYISFQNVWQWRLIVNLVVKKYN